MNEGIEARCPFCGQLQGLVTELADETSTDGSSTFCVVCQECGAQGPHAEDAEEAIRFWADRDGVELDGDDEQLDPELASALEKAITRRVHSLLKQRR